MTSTLDVTPVWPNNPLIIAGWELDQERVGGAYNGKIDSPRLANRVLIGCANVERAWLRAFALPVGLSLFGVLRNPVS